jgi:hypothetical protein
MDTLTRQREEPAANRTLFGRVFVSGRSAGGRVRGCGNELS